MAEPFRIKITETTTATGSAELMVPSETAEMAAAQMLVAYQRAKASGTNVLVLPSGQRDLLERDQVVSASIRFDLLDADGMVIREIVQAAVHRSMM